MLLGLVVWTLARWSLARGWYRSGLLASAFLIDYGVFRFLIKFTWQPDAQLGLIVGPFSMGQLLSMGMPILGVLLLVLVARRQVDHYRTNSGNSGLSG